MTELHLSNPVMDRTTYFRSSVDSKDTQQDRIRAHQSLKLSEHMHNLEMKAHRKLISKIPKSNRDMELRSRF